MRHFGPRSPLQLDQYGPVKARRGQRGAAGVAYLAAGAWLLAVALAFWHLWQTFGAGGGAAANAGWARAAAFFMAAIGAGPILLYLTAERTGLLSSQTDNDALRRITEAFTKAVELLGHQKIAVRQGGIHALDRIAKDNLTERSKVMHIMAAYIRDGSAVYVDDTIATFRKAGEPGGHAEARLRRDLLLRRAREALGGGEGGGNAGAGPGAADARLAMVRQMIDSANEGMAIGERQIMEGLLPVLPMPIDLKAAITVMHRQLSVEGAGAQRGRQAHEEDDALDLSGVYLYGADLRGVRLRGADFSNSRLYGCWLEGADLSKVRLHGANICHTNLNGALLQDAHMQGADLRGSSLSLANLQRAWMPRVNLAEAILRGADLQRAQMTNARLAGATLSDASLEGATLFKANLRGATLRDTQLEGANLKEADLSGADLMEADFLHAKTQGAELHGTDLRGARHLTQEQIDSAFGNADTQLPVDLTIPPHWTEATSGEPAS